MGILNHFLNGIGIATILFVIIILILRISGIILVVDEEKELLTVVSELQGEIESLEGQIDESRIFRVRVGNRCEMCGRVLYITEEDTLRNFTKDYKAGGKSGNNR